MKKIYLFIIFSILMIAVVGCGTTGTGTDSGRDISKMEDAIIGHWESNDNAEMYIDSKNIFSITKGAKEEFSYSVIKSNDEEGIIEINRTRSDMEDSDYKIEITFIDDKRTEMVEDSLAIKEIYKALGKSGDESKTTWKYVDDKTNP